MKRSWVIIVIFSILFSVTACAENNNFYSPEDGSNKTTTKQELSVIKTNPPSSVPTTTSTPPEVLKKSLWEQLEKKYPLVAYDDIRSGKYTNKTVRIIGVVEEIDFVVKDLASVLLWYQIGDTYVPSSKCAVSYAQDSVEYGDYALLKPGDTIEYVKAVSDRDTIIPLDSVAMRLVETGDIDPIYKTYMKYCPAFKYDSIARNPDDYRDTSHRVTGKVFQLIEEEDRRIELLLDTKEGIVYIYWNKDKELRGPRILEGDRITVYGQFHQLKTYDTLFGQNTIPAISAVIINSQ